MVFVVVAGLWCSALVLLNELIHRKKIAMCGKGKGLEESNMNQQFLLSHVIKHVPETNDAEI